MERYEISVKASIFEKIMSSSTTPILQVNQLSICFSTPEPWQAVQDIQFGIEAGKTLALVGASGSGKSLTALALMGLLPENSTVQGSILLAETRLDKLDKKQWQKIRGKRIGMIFQEPMCALNPVKTCGYQLQECIRTHQLIGKQAAKKQSIDWLRRVKLPDPERLFQRYPHELSGGQKQRVMIAMALCNHPQLLIADEPTTALDVTVQKEIIELIQELQQQYGIALLFITHDLALARQITQDFLVLEQGKVVATPPQSAVINSVGDLVTDEKRPLLQVSQLKVYYPHKTNLWGKPIDYFKAVDDVSFSIYPGETLGLVGESGCGKSTLSKSLLGLQAISSGKVYFDGQNISTFDHEKSRRLRRDIQIIFQDPYAALNQRMKIGDALAEPMKVHHQLSTSVAKKNVLDLLEKVQLPSEAYYKYPHEFSGGQRQRICIARALALAPKLVICDESVSALDVRIQEQILELLVQLQRDLGLSYLFITHDLQVVKRVAHRIMVMRSGKIVELGTSTQIMDAPQHPYTQQLLAAAPGV